MHVEVEGGRREQLELIEAHLLQYLTSCGRQQGRIARFEVAARLQPTSELAMENQQQGVALGRENEGTGCEVAGGKMIARVRIPGAGDQLLHPRQVGSFFGIVRRKRRKLAAQVSQASLHEGLLRGAGQGVKAGTQDTTSILLGATCSSLPKRDTRK